MPRRRPGPRLSLDLAPSRLAAPLLQRCLPSALRRRHGPAIAEMLARADMVATGQDDTARSQRGAVLAFAIRMASAFIAYLSQVLIAWWLGAGEYGIFVWVWTALIVISLLASLGFPSAAVRFVAQYGALGQGDLLRGFLRGSRLLAFLAGTLVALAGAVGVHAFAHPIESPYVAVLVLGLVCLPVMCLGNVQDGIARARDWIDLALGATFLVRPLLMLAFMAGALAFGLEAGARVAILAAIAACWVTTAWQLAVMQRRLARVVEPGARAYPLRRWLAVALPIFLVEGFYQLLVNVDILIVALFVPPEQVAVYFAVVKTLALAHFVHYAVKAGAAHRYASYHSTGDVRAFRRLTAQTARWTFWPTLAVAVALLLFGRWLLALFGPGFEAGYPLLFIVAFGVIVRATVGPAEAVLTMTGHQNVCAALYGTSLLVNIVLNFALIPIFGLMGAAMATAIAMTFETVALYAAMQRRLGLSMSAFARAGTGGGARPERASGKRWSAAACRARRFPTSPSRFLVRRAGRSNWRRRRPCRV